MGFFTKKITVYKEKGCKAHWQTAKKALKSAGISFSSTSLPSEAPTCGCGAKLDIRDFGPKNRPGICTTLMWKKKMWTGPGKSWPPLTEPHGHDKIQCTHCTRGCTGFDGGRWCAISELGSRQPH